MVGVMVPPIIPHPDVDDHPFELHLVLDIPGRLPGVEHGVGVVTEDVRPAISGIHAQF